MRIWKKKLGWLSLPKDLITVNPENNEQTVRQSLHTCLSQNMALVRKMMGNAEDLTIREFTIAADNKIKAAIIALNGMTERNLINEQVLKTLMQDIRFPMPMERAELFRRIKDYGISNLEVKESLTVEDVVRQVISGDTVFLLDGINTALMVGTRGWKDRSITDPATESVVRGPRDSFSETILTNVVLIRRRIKSPDLRVERITVGELTRTDVMIVYLEGVARQDVVHKLKDKLQGINIDGILESGYIEEFIEENPLSPFPQVEYSERPDKVSAAILEGRVAILVDNTPFVLTVPVIFWQFFQSPEDYYERFYMASLKRMIRLGAYLLAVTLPAFYIALTSYHHEMIPTTLALTIAASREGVPFPAVGEALLMGATFEVLREAGIRMPRPIGQAVSIVGALVIGQAAVQAGVVSQAMVIIVGLTGISSFAIPAYSLAVTGRLLTFLLVIIASVFGIFGILAVLSVILIHMSGISSFGVNYLSPITSVTVAEFKDIAIRSPWWTMWRRPAKIAGKQKNRVNPGQKPKPEHEE